jgi:hypothetical protein
MDIFDGLRVVARWWFVVVPILIVSITVAFVSTDNIDPEFSAEASVLFVGPNVRETDTAGLEAINPILVQPSALTTTAEVAALSANTVQVRTLLGREGFSTDYSVAAQRSNPIVIVETRAPTRDLATTSALRVVEVIDEDLRLRQDAADAPAEQRVSTTIIGVSAVGGADYGGRNRARIALVVIGIGLAVGAAFLMEGRSRRAPKSSSDDLDDDVEPMIDPDLDDDVEPMVDPDLDDVPQTVFDAEAVSSADSASGSAASTVTPIEKEREPARRR